MIVVAMAVTIAVLYGAGTYLLLQRNLSRIVLGLAVLGHGANLLLLMAGGRAGRPPIVGLDEPSAVADPLPQALALTAIVITFGVNAFLLALAYRSWLLNRSDEVEDDVEDRRIAAAVARFARSEEAREKRERMEAEAQEPAE
ncbi:MAG TPA: Na(+)/H(+) antiporter subunit C [Acidimicrobiia bacterium]|jgi:multicomponent Na+:H+ antiporter subunit C|nr:Na(+)/H(+) antiporter subunit C [Acidimicrobiia bacterium]